MRYSGEFLLNCSSTFRTCFSKSKTLALCLQILKVDERLLFRPETFRKEWLSFKAYLLFLESPKINAVCPPVPLQILPRLLFFMFLGIFSPPRAFEVFENNSLIYYTNFGASRVYNGEYEFELWNSLAILDSSNIPCR